MELDHKRWYVQLYLWCLTLWDNFLVGEAKDIRGRDWSKTNLCQFIRTIFVWAPLVLAVNAGLLAFAGYVFLYYPVTRFGVGGYVMTLLAAAIFLGLVCGAAILSFKLLGAIRDWFFYRAESSASRRNDSERQSMSFFAIIRAWLRALKERTCPMITFVDEPTNGEEVES